MERRDAGYDRQERIAGGGNGVSGEQSEKGAVLTGMYAGSSGGLLSLRAKTSDKDRGSLEAGLSLVLGSW